MNFIFLGPLLFLVFVVNVFGQTTAPTGPGTTSVGVNEGPSPEIIQQEKKEKIEQEKKDMAPTALEQQSQMSNFDKIKDILKNDRLDAEAKKIETTVKKVVQKRQADVSKRYQAPNEGDFWSFFSEYWLVKNVTVLKWDFAKPDYGLDVSFAEFLEKMGILEKHFKIILIDSPLIPHFALPSNSEENIFILSVPFIRTLDLSKLEIALLLFEDIVRHRQGHFMQYLADPKLKEFLGKNFYGKQVDSEIFKELLKKYDTFLFDKGFSFQQQFEVTKEMDQVLRADLKLWNTYIGLIKKIDELVKSNLLYSKYNNLYPSPELQLGWLIPKKE